MTGFLCLLLGHAWRPVRLHDAGGWWLASRCTRCDAETVGALLRDAP